MSDTANLALPCIEGSQAQKHVTHNEALRLLDTLVQLAVLDRDLTAPPGSPLEGQRWIVKTGATGAWASHVNAIAAWQDGAWQFATPRTGWLAYAIDESALLAWNGSAWVDAVGAMSPTALNNMSLLGVGTTADAANPLSAKLNNTLFVAKTVAEGGDGHLRYKLSKESAAKTLSFLFQDNYSGRAEFGLTGDDDFHFKVSADGSVWHEGIVINRTTGAVSFPNSTIAVAGRELLTANRTYYVRTDGSDGNNGLANTSSGAFLTVQKAVDSAVSLDLGIYAVTISIADGSYTGAVTLKSYLGVGPITLQGNTGTPANVAVSVTGATAIAADGVLGAWALNGMKISATTSGNGVYALNGARLTLTNVHFGAATGAHIRSDSGALITVSGSYTIAGNAGRHWLAVGGTIRTNGAATITLTGTPAFANVFADSQSHGLLTVNAQTFSGAATGTRYSVALNGVINTIGGGASYFPGDAGGSSATGGQYA